MIRRLIFSLFIFILYSNSILNAQAPDIYGFRVGRGFILPHHEFMRYYIKKNITEFNLTFGYQSSGKYQWQKSWGYPDIGAGIYYADLGNRDILGSSTALYFFADLPIYKSQFFNFSGTVSLGGAYLSKHFDYKTNYLNVAIATHLNIFANLNLKAVVKTQKMNFFLNLGFTHYSNGGTKEPNLGLNIPSLALGINYKTINYSKNSSVISNFKPHYDIQVVQSVSARATAMSVSNPIKPLSTFSADMGKYVSHASRFGAGLDVLYDGCAYYHLSVDNDTLIPTSKYFAAGLHLSYNAIFGKVQFAFQQIYYIYQPYGFFRNCQRYGFRFIVAKRIVLGLALTTHFFQALYIEPGIGFKINM